MSWDSDDILLALGFVIILGWVGLQIVSIVFGAIGLGQQCKEMLDIYLLVSGILPFVVALLAFFTYCFALDNDDTPEKYPTPDYRKALYYNYCSEIRDSGKLSMMQPNDSSLRLLPSTKCVWVWDSPSTIEKKKKKQQNNNHFHHHGNNNPFPKVCDSDGDYPAPPLKGQQLEEIPTGRYVTPSCTSITVEEVRNFIKEYSYSHRQPEYISTWSARRQLPWVAPRSCTQRKVSKVAGIEDVYCYAPRGAGEEPLWYTIFTYATLIVTASAIFGCLGWLIYGTYLVSRSSLDTCQPTLYRMALSTVVLNWVIPAVFVIIALLILFCIF